MNQYLIILMAMLACYSAISVADEKEVYDYDKYHHEICTKTGDKRKMLKFDDSGKYNNRPFIYFNNLPAIAEYPYQNGDIITYTVLPYHSQAFYIDCVYYK